MNPLTDNLPDLEQVIRSILQEYHARPTALIMVLQDIQKQYHYLREDVLKKVAREMNLPIAQLYGVATFYKSFSLKPKGKNHICVCTGTACHVRQANVILTKLEMELGIKAGETTPDGNFSFETVNCLGACALGPLVTANDNYYGHMTTTKIDKMLDTLRGKTVADDAEEETV